MANLIVKMKTSGAPVKRIPVKIQHDDVAHDVIETATDRFGMVSLDQIHGSGNIFIDGRSYYQGPLDQDIEIELWSLTSGSGGTDSGAPSGIDGGSIAYPAMQTDYVMVNGHKVLTCSEGYIMHPAEWSEDFVEALAEKEGLVLTDEHWDVIRYLRDYYNEKNVQCTVRDMIKHYRKTWGKERGNNKYLHDIFPKGGPQKQGNRLAGLLRTKGEH